MVLVQRLQHRLCLVRMAAAAVKVLMLKPVYEGDRAKAVAAWVGGRIHAAFEDLALHAATCLAVLRRVCPCCCALPFC